MKDTWHSSNHKKYLLQIHLILVTKYRKKILKDNLSDDVKQYSKEICDKHNVKINCMECDKDHIHYMLDLPTSISVEKLVKLIKSYTTFHIWKRYNLSTYYWKEKTLWTDGYFVCSVGNVSQKQLRKYIENQG